MTNYTEKKTRRELSWVIQVLILLIFLVSFAGQSVWAQPVTPPLLKAIRVYGLRDLPERDAQKMFTLNAPLDSAALSERLERLVKVAQRMGFYDCRIDSVRKFFSADSADLSLEVYFFEGKPYQLSEIKFRGNRLFSADELKQTLATREGEALDSETLEKDLDDLLNRYEQLGRPFAKITTGDVDLIPPKKDDEPPTLKLTIDIDEGSIVKITGFAVSGNVTTQPDVLTRELPIAVGDLFNSEKFSQIKSRLERLGLFEKVGAPELVVLQPKGAAWQPNDTIQGVIKLSITEGNTNTFDGVVGYQPPLTPSDEGFFTGLVNISLRNLFGSGRKLAVRWVRPNNPTQELRLNYQEPWLFGVPLTITLDLMQLKQDSSFSQLQLGAVAQYRLSQNLFLTGVVQRESINPIFEGAPRLEPVLQSAVTLTGLGILYDSRDYIPNPTSGLLFRNDYRIGTKSIAASDSILAVYQFQPNVVQQRVLVEAEFYQQTFRRHVIALRAFGQAILASEIQFADLFRFGGAQTLRGYREQQFLASRYAFSNLEYRVLLSQNAFAFLFWDVGYFYKAANPLNALDGVREGWRNGFGLGARIDTPLGIVGVSYALGEGDTILRGKVHFNLINQF